MLFFFSNETISGGLLLWAGSDRGLTCFGRSFARVLYILTGMVKKGFAWIGACGLSFATEITTRLNIYSDVTTLLYFEVLNCYVARSPVLGEGREVLPLTSLFLFEKHQPYQQ